MSSVKLLVSAAALSVLAAGCAEEAPAQSATQHLSTAQCDVFARDGRITICHATGSTRNPVVVMRVAEAACVNAHSDHPGDYVAVDGDCGPNACLPQTAPCDATLRCCDGLTCNAGTCVNIDACATNACGANATCSDLPAPAPGDASGRTCACNAGYEGDGITCRDINACATNACGDNATCTDLAAPAPGDASGRTCACNPGFEGNGLQCTDINACATNACGANATCTDLPAPASGDASGRSCACDAGYEGDGITCRDIDACATNACGDNATCADLAAPAPGDSSGRTCTCNTGYQGDGASCADVNECAMNNGGCATGATCTNTPGGRTCACSAGYEGDGLSCTDINECATNNGGCIVQATCTNTPGGRACACNVGYTGNGLTCTASGSSCNTATGFCYTDTPADNVAGQALRNYFTGLGTVSPSDFIYFGIATGGAGAQGGAWCAERADWYVSNYLTRALPGSAQYGSYVMSPSGHRRYMRLEGMAWSAPQTNSYYNFFGPSCDGTAYSWCSEWGISAGSLGLSLGTMPDRTDQYGESYVGNGTYWSYGAGWAVTIRVAATRLEACGF